MPYGTVTTCCIRDSEGSDLAWVNSVTGNLYLKGKLYENVEMVWSIPVDSIKIKMDMEVMVFITSEGYLSLFLLDWYLLEVASTSLSKGTCFKQDSCAILMRFSTYRGFVLQ